MSVYGHELHVAKDKTGRTVGTCACEKWDISTPRGYPTPEVCIGDAHSLHLKLLKSTVTSVDTLQELQDK